MRYNYHTLDVFTTTVFGGNPLAVLPDARGLTDSQMLAIAREFNLSETTFVFPPENPTNTRRLRIFTPGGELPFAGHPTVGTAVLLAAIGEIPLQGDATQIVFEEGIGPVPVTIFAENGTPTSAQLSVAKLPEFGPGLPDPAALAAVISLELHDLVLGPISPCMLSVGLPFVFIQVKDRDALARAQISSAAWKSTLDHAWAREVCVFTRDAELSGSDIRARVFVPTLSIPEDPATGSAAAAFCGWLAAEHELISGTRGWTIEQGFEMGRPSIINVEVDANEGEITAVRVSGNAVRVSDGVIDVPA